MSPKESRRERQRIPQQQEFFASGLSINQEDPVDSWLRGVESPRYRGMVGSQTPPGPSEPTTAGPQDPVRSWLRGVENPKDRDRTSSDYQSRATARRAAATVYPESGISQYHNLPSTHNINRPPTGLPHHWREILSLQPGADPKIIARSHKIYSTKEKEASRKDHYGGLVHVERAILEDYAQFLVWYAVEHKLDPELHLGGVRQRLGQEFDGWNVNVLLGRMLETMINLCP